MKMNKKIQVLAVASLFSAIPMSSLDQRAPLIGDRGAMRYLFDFDEPKDDRNIRVWAASVFRYAGQAYNDKVGTDAGELTRLIFNQSSFKISEAFPNCLIGHNGEFYNPLLRTAHVYAKAAYYESSMVVGGSYALPVYQDRGRIGVRVVVPFRNIRLRRMDEDAVPRGGDLQDVLAFGQAQKDPSLSDAVNQRLSPMVRIDFAEALIQSTSRNPALIFSNKDGKPVVGGLEISDPDNVGPEATNRSVKRCLGVVRSPAGLIPRQPDVPATAVSMKAADVGTGLGGSLGSSAVMPGDGNIEYGTIYRFEATGAKKGQYADLAEEVAESIDDRVARQNLKEELWLIPSVRVGDDVSGAEDGGSMKVLRDLSDQVTENSFEWLKDRGYVFESDTMTGLGDIDVTFFYEHALNDNCYGEISGGFKAPTARDHTDVEKIKGPYRAMLGNGRHWEFKLGGSLACKPISWLNIRGDCSYNFALPKEEYLRVAFKGARIKNFAQLVPATTSWTYFVAHVDATIFHLKSHAISNMIGYELYYKEKDMISFPRNSSGSWLGRKFAIDGFAQDNQSLVDEQLFTQNTDAIGHRVKFETSMRMTDQCELFISAAYTFAGKNVPREFDASVGLNVVF